jgi:hypothetical protein
MIRELLCKNIKTGIVCEAVARRVIAFLVQFSCFASRAKESATKWQEGVSDTKDKWTRELTKRCVRAFVCSPAVVES